VLLIRYAPDSLTLWIKGQNPNIHPHPSPSARSPQRASCNSSLAASLVWSTGVAAVQAAIAGKGPGIHPLPDCKQQGKTAPSMSAGFTQEVQLWIRNINLKQLTQQHLPTGSAQSRPTLPTGTQAEVLELGRAFVQNGPPFLAKLNLWLKACRHPLQPMLINEVRFLCWWDCVVLLQAGTAANWI